MVDLNIIITILNTAGLGDYTKRRKTFNYLKSRFLVKGSYSCQKPTVYKRMKRYGQTSLAVVRILLYFYGKSDARGVLVAFREGLKYKVRAQYVDDTGRYIVLDALFDNNPVILVNN